NSAKSQAAIRSPYLFAYLWNLTDHTLHHMDSLLFKAVLKCGVHLPLHPYIKSIIDYYGVVPFQLTPNTYRYMVGLYILYHKLGLETTPSPEEFAWFYQVKSNPSDLGFFYASKWSN
ncbi:hypothetical protein PanWU01x14_033670, partial [Parasponia andersonii]